MVGVKCPIIDLHRPNILQFYRWKLEGGLTSTCAWAGFLEFFGFVLFGGFFGIVIGDPEKDLNTKISNSADHTSFFWVDNFCANVEDLKWVPTKMSGQKHDILCINEKM